MPGRCSSCRFYPEGALAGVCVLKWVKTSMGDACNEYVARRGAHDREQARIAGRLYELGFKVKVEASVPKEVRSLEEYVTCITRNLTVKSRVRPEKGYVVVDVLAVREPLSYSDDVESLKNKVYLIEVAHRKGLAGDVEKLSSLKVPARKIIVPVYREAGEVRIVPLKDVLRAKI